MRHFMHFCLNVLVAFGSSSIYFSKMPRIFVAFYDLCGIKFKSYHFSQDGNPFSRKLFIARFYQEYSISFFLY